MRWKLSILTTFSENTRSAERIRRIDNTIVIVTSDHGMPFPRCKGQEYEYSNHIPFAIMWKNGILEPGRKINDYISVIDIAPTLLELAELILRHLG